MMAASVAGKGGSVKQLVAVVVAAGLMMAACGGDGDPDTADTDTGGSTSVESTVAPTSSVAAPETTTPDTEAPAPTTGATTEPADTSAPTTVADDIVADGVNRVPDEFDTIQAAVDAAQPGDLVLIGPGTYHEAVDVVTDELTIRGTVRDTVVLDGQLELDNGIRVLGANGVAVENLTAMNYTNNGVFWVSSEGYRASYVTTYRTGDYGIYAFDSVGGQIEHSHTVGSRDAGVYIGQCYPCDAVIDDVISSNNGLGYSGTNSGGNLLIINSVWHNNRVGLLPNSGSYELCYPERATTIVGNLVYDNNQPDTPAIDWAHLAQGNGILVAGGIGNIIERNRVDDHFRTGIGLIPYPEETPNDELPTQAEWALSCDEQKSLETVIPAGSMLWYPYDNEVRDNVVTNSGEADIALAAEIPGVISEFRNCFSGNSYATSAPTALESLAPCDGEASDGDWTVGDLGAARWLAEQADLPLEVPWQEAPLPELGAHESMPDAETAPPRPATDVPYDVDLDAITTPELPSGVTPGLDPGTSPPPSDCWPEYSPVAVCPLPSSRARRRFRRRTGSSPDPRERVGQFVVECGFDRFLADDPIVHPGASGASHLHQFFGAVDVSVDSTYDEMLAGDTTCDQQRGHRLVLGAGIARRRRFAGRAARCGGVLPGGPRRRPDVGGSVSTRVHDGGRRSHRDRATTAVGGGLVVWGRRAPLGAPTRLHRRAEPA